MEIKAQITKKLQKYKADEIKTLYQLMLRVLSGNDDFRMVQNADTDDLRPVIEGETGEKIDFAMESIISGESLKLWQDIQAEEAEKVKLKKADRIERIASVMSDAALFEGFCLAFYGKDEMLAVLCDEYGCLEAYEALVQDTVYRKRRAYMRMLSDYVLAASHLYGVVALHDFELLLRYYEKNLDDFDGYAREEGSYKNTILFQPRYLGLCTLQQLIGNTVPEVLTTMDGLFLHPSFTEDFQKEQKEMVKAFAKNGGQNVGEKDFDQFFAAAGEKTSYRKLLRDTMDKPMYLPTKEEFLKYVNEDYHVISTAEKNLRNYLKGKYGKELETAAQAAGTTAEVYLEAFIAKLRDLGTDVGKGGAEPDPQAQIQFVLTTLRQIGAAFENIADAKEPLRYAMELSNAEHLWCNRGFSADGLAVRMAAEKKNPYVMTIGFRKNNPEHIQVAEFLNSLEREKAQYIVKAVLTYRTLEEKGEVPQTGGAVSYDYETIKSIVLQIMREQGADGKIPAVQPETASLSLEAEPKEQITEEDSLIGFDESAMQGIMASLSAFQNQN